MRDDITTGSRALAAQEAICDQLNPPVIVDYLSASDEDKALFELTFKAFKTNTQLKARERWYDWKMGLMERVRPDVEEHLDLMREVSAVFARPFWSREKCRRRKWTPGG